MSIRAQLLSTLATGLTIGLLAAPGSAFSRDETVAMAAAGRIQSTQTPARPPIKVAPIQVEGCTAVDATGRCLAVPGRLMADHGASVDEPYDVQGNLLDRNGNVIAVPGNRGHREVFVTLDR